MKDARSAQRKLSWQIAAGKKEKPDAIKEKTLLFRELVSFLFGFSFFIFPKEKVLPS